MRNLPMNMEVEEKDSNSDSSPKASSNQENETTAKKKKKESKVYQYFEIRTFKVAKLNIEKRVCLECIKEQR